MSKPSLRAVLPRSHVRARGRTLYTASFNSLHHAHIDAGLMPSARGQPVPGSPRMTTSGGVSSPSSPSPSPPTQPDALSLLFDISAFQASTQIAHHPAPPPTPPLQNPAPAQPGARMFPLPLASTSLPASLAALPPMSYYQQILATIPSSMVAPVPAKKPRATFALESAAYGIPKHRSRGTSSGSPLATSSFAAGAARAVDMASVSDADMHLAVQVGEDAYFLLPNALGVSDGVGGWTQKARSQGTAPPSRTGPSASALFSRRLMHFCADEISALGSLPESWPSPPVALAIPSAPAGQQHAPATTAPSPAGLNATAPVAAVCQDPQSPDLLDPVAVLQRAYARAVTLSRADHSLCGSSTALVAILLGDELRVAHLGDCALCLVRNGQMVFRSEEQQWKFNHPLQLGPFSSTVPGDAQRIAFKVQPDDILILSSDGMSDNMWDEDVLDEVKKFTSRDRGSGAAAIIRKHAMPSMLSEALCSRAKRASEVRPPRPNGDTASADRGSDAEFDNEVPFARRAREEGIKFAGGKADDISVLVAVIASAQEEAIPTAEGLQSIPVGSRSAPASLSPIASAASNLTFLTAWSSQ